MKVYEMVGEGLLEVDGEEWSSEAGFGVFLGRLEDEFGSVEIETLEMV